MRWTVKGPDAIHALYRLRIGLGEDPDPDIIIGGTTDDAFFDCPEFLFQAAEWQHDLRVEMQALALQGYRINEDDT